MRVQIVNRMAEKCANLFRELSKQPTPIGAFCHRVRGCVDQLEVVGQWEQRDLTRMEKTSFQRSYIINTAGPVVSLVAATTPVELNRQLRAYSFDGRWLAILRSVQNSQGTDKQYLEIWNDNSKIKTIDLLAQEKHLNVMVDGRFGCLRWSHCGTKLLYSAERFYKTESYFKPASAVQDDPEKQRKTSATRKGEEFLFRENWGEALFQAHSPSIYTFHVENEEISEVAGINANVSCGQAIWTPDSLGIVFVGYQQTPFRLGLIFCNNRRSALYHADLESGNCNVIGSLEDDVEDPRFSLDGNSLVYFRSRPSGPHFSTQSIMKCDWSSKIVTTVIKEVHGIERQEQFPGLYTVGVPKRIWSSDNGRVILHSIWRSRQELVCVDVVSGEVTRLTNDPEFGNWYLLDVYEDYIVAVRSSPNRNPSLVLGKLPSKGNFVDIMWITLDDTKLTARDLGWEIMVLKPPYENVNAKYPGLDYEALLVTLDSSDTKSKPLIVFPHGGPHSSITAMHILSVEYFCRLGFAVLMVNYRGSLGFGQESIESLLGNIGTQDVQDMAFAVETALKSGNLDRERMVLYGGSHGGFLVLTLAGLYPDQYRACVARNPVVDICGMVGVTDIPDWSFVETGLRYNMTSLHDTSSAKTMWERSPIRLVDKIKIPVLFTLGRIDLRVPHYQGLLMHRALRARNVESRVHMYEDNHSLQKVASESDGLVNSAKWMIKYIE